MSVLSGVKNLRNDIEEINEDFFALGLNIDQSEDIHISDMDASNNEICQNFSLYSKEHRNTTTAEHLKSNRA